MSEPLIRARAVGGTVTHVFEEVTFPSWKLSKSLCGKDFILARRSSFAGSYSKGRRPCKECERKAGEKQDTSVQQT